MHRLVSFKKEKQIIMVYCASLPSTKHAPPPAFPSTPGHAMQQCKPAFT